ncbi:MAG: tetraacyldisaccharide 4'-kinase [Alphaproteobacteria bacterium]|nr:tetraacyldisaccharide 4'-kinase [Alphaproteobacteria bacterium]
MREPGFWWREPGLTAAALSPLGAIYGAIAGSRMARKGWRAPVPVICVGNFTLGGSGKTPTVMALAEILAKAGHRPVLLSRGYGGNATTPLMVDRLAHLAAQVGDEALLLARAAPTIVAPNRVAGAAAAIQAGATIIIMDDGLQNPSLTKDFTVAVVDGVRGIGNSKVFPAGPLRAPMKAQWSHVDALLVVGETTVMNTLQPEAASRGIACFHGMLKPNGAAVASLQGHKVLAFAGIGNPDKFFTSLEGASIAVAERKAFADHHRYTAEEAAALLMQAEQQGLELVTTEKDSARMAGEPGLAALRARARPLPVTLALNDEKTLRDLMVSKARL